MRSGWTEKQSQKWVKDHGYKLKQKDIKKQDIPTEWRYNQLPKQKFKQFVTKILPGGIHFIFGSRT
jgi:hypothetical protein